MKTLNLKNLFHFLLTTSAALLIFAPVIGFAGTTTEEVILECCTDTNCPTKHDSPGKEGVTQTVTFKAQVVTINGEEMVIPVFGDPGYYDWQDSIFERYDEKTADNIVDAANVSVVAQCSSGGVAHSISGSKGRTLTCPEGDTIIIDDDLKCPDSFATGPYSVIELTKTKKEGVENENLDGIIGDRIGLEVGPILPEVGPIPDRGIMIGGFSQEELMRMEVDQLIAVTTREFDRSLAELPEIRERREALDVRFGELRENLRQRGFFEALAQVATLSIGGSNL